MARDGFEAAPPTRMRTGPARLAIVLLIVACASLLGVSVLRAADHDNAGSPVASTSVVVVDPVPRSGTQSVHPQISNVAKPISDHYLKADSVALALAIVPDPLVPRYRRIYDLSIAALELGMLKDGYVLDRFQFPWSEELQRNAAGARPNADSNTSNLSDGSFGLMIFRCDAWRGDLCNYPGATPDSEHQLPASTRIRALYLVTETATSGVAPFQLKCALKAIEAQTGIASATPPSSDTRTDQPAKKPVDSAAPPPPRQCEPTSVPKGVPATLLQHHLCPPPEGGKSRIVALGPSFSGSVDSVGATVEGRSPNDLRDICLLSSFASDTTNQKVTKKYSSIYYHSAALDNRHKLEHLAQLREYLGATGRSDVAILAEASTFGYGVCHDNEDPNAQSKELCASPTFYFPPTIADIAYGIQKQQAQQANDLANAARQVQDDRHVSLETGAENGSEFPANTSATVTSASNQLQLDLVMDELTLLGPKIVVVVATDVRDRLFLFNQLRARLPRALLVDLEADNLLAHPAFLHSSRGALALASVNLNSTGSMLYGCEMPDSTDQTRSIWSIDGQALLSDNVARLYEQAMPLPVSRMPCENQPAMIQERQAALQLVTLHGFMPVSYVFPDQARSLETPARPAFSALVLAESLGCVFCIVLPALWLWPWILRWRDQDQSLDSEYLARMEKRVVLPAILAAVPFFLIALVVAYNSTSQRGHSLMYWVVAMEILGAVSLWRCYVQIRRTLWASINAVYSAPWLSASLAVMGVGFGCAATVVSSRMDITRQSVNPTLINALGFDPQSGVAFYLMVILVVVVTLYASAILATRIWVVRRNFMLLHRASMLVTDSTPFIGRNGENEPVKPLHGYKPIPLWAVALVSTVIVAAAGAPGLLDYLGGPRLTIFGPFAAKVAVFALSATTLCAAILVSAAYGAGRRMIALCGYVRSRVLEKAPRRRGRSVGVMGLWTGGAEMPNAFPATPVLAIDSGAGAFSREVWSDENANDESKPGKVMSTQEQAGDAWAALLAEILYKGSLTGRTRFALFALLVSELSLFRWIALGTVLCAFSGVAIVYLYPIEADTLLILNLVILALAGVLCAYMAVLFERDEVLSNIVCNRPKKTEISVGLFSFIASPFLALAAAIALIGVPGVVDWAGGLFVMLRALGIHP